MQVKRVSRPPFLSAAHREAAPAVLGARERQPCRDLLLNSSEFGRLSQVVHIEGSGGDANPRLVIAMDTYHILRIARDLGQAQIRPYAAKRASSDFQCVGFPRSIPRYAFGGIT